nr:ABC transporter permease [uncultured Bacteroides sp.]
MIKQYFNQAWAQLRQQPLISAVSIVGTALAIFLIMLVVMMQQVHVVSFAPESNRDRFLHVKWMSISNKDWGDGTSNGPMSVRTARECFQSLKTPEAVSIYACQTESTPVNLPGQPSTGVDMLQTDDVFWRIFDFSFTAGKPYDKATFDAGIPVAVITESVSRHLFGTTESVGHEFLLNHAPYRVCGVVKDVSTLATTAYGQVWIPFTSTNFRNDVWSEHMGMASCIILARDRNDFPAIREEAERRQQEYNTLIGEQGYELIYRNRPYDQEKNALLSGANVEPDVNAARRQRLIIFAILLIVPAINLSSMTQSRLRQRVSEVGVRRAFGSTRMEIMGQIVAENMVVTLFAGVLGLLLSVVFAYLGESMLFAEGFSKSVNAPLIDASILLHASTFGWALLFCFILNLLSSGIPAWKASRIGIVNALGGKLQK